jgi:HlyD family secretion protein
VLEQNDTLRPVPVKTGITDNTLTEVIDGGLQPGDRVVTRETGERKDTGNFRIRVM